MSDSSQQQPPMAVAPEFAAQYDIGKVLGRGAFSVVYEAKKKDANDNFAVKVIRKDAVRMDQQRRLDLEVQILKSMHHPNIIPLYDIIETKSYLYLVMELVEGGELFERIVARGYYTEKEASKLIKNVLNAIAYLHQNMIAHRDLKPENLLLKQGDDTHVMISDFGLSKVLGDSSMAFTACGTPYYVAPEVLTGGGYGKEVDLWSIGVITYFLLAGFPPFMGESLRDIVEQIIVANYEFPAPYFDAVSATGKDFIRKLLVVDKNARLNVRQALAHPWIENIESIPDEKLTNVQHGKKPRRLDII